jgi:hypothetical protein
MNLWPMIVKYRHFSFCKLIIKLLISDSTKIAKLYIAWALNDRLTITIQTDWTIFTISYSKLFCCSYHCNISTISNENCWLTRCNIYKTIMAPININVSSYIKNIKFTVITIVYIELLRIQSIYFFNSKFRSYIDKSIVVKVYIFLISINFLWRNNWLLCLNNWNSGNLD